MSKFRLSYGFAVSIVLVLFLLVSETTGSFCSSPSIPRAFKNGSGTLDAISPQNNNALRLVSSLALTSARIPKGLSGTLRVLVIPVKFSNFSNMTDIQTGLSVKTASLASYYNEVSYGALTLDIQSLTDWLTLSHTREYYGNDSETTIDVNWVAFVSDSLNAAEAYVNFHDYGYVLLVHAGEDEAGYGDAYDLWSQASLGKEYFLNDGGVNLGFAILAEKDPYGVFAHEFGHNIELSDLYDYNDVPRFVGDWSLMDYGSWLVPPSSLMAPEKMWLNWIQPDNTTVVTSGQILNVTLAKIEQPGGVSAVKIPVDGKYYVVEYRRKVLTDSDLPMEGVIVSLVDESLDSGQGIVRVMNADPSSTSLRDAAFTAGTRFVDSNTEVAVKVLSLDSDNATIRVQKGFADLVAEQIEIVGEVFQGENVSFNVHVKNTGVTASENARVSLAINGTVFQTRELPTVDPGGETILEFGPWQAEVGLNNIRVKVDVDNDVVEKNKTNDVISSVLDVPEHYVSVDQALVSRQRVDVNSSQQVHFHAEWNDNGSDIVGGTIFINGTAYVTNETGWVTVDWASSETVNVTWFVSGVDLQGFGSFKQEVPNPWIVWDMLSAYDSGVSKERCNVNSTQTVWVKMRYAYDGKVFENSTGTLQVNGEPATWSSQNGYWMITVSERTIGQSNYITPSAFEDYLFGLTLMTGQHQVSIMWDMVNLTTTAENTRTSVGSVAVLDVNGTYSFDSTVWNGTVVFNDTLTKDGVGRFSYSVVSILDPLYGLTAFSSNTVNVIFDRVFLTLSVLNSRINVGETAPVGVAGFYEYDLSPWNGDFTLNDTLTKNEVGLYEFKVASFTDRNYNLTTFQSSSILIIWDRVNLTLSCAQERVSVGSEAPIVWTGKYQFDQTAFQGNITLSENLTRNSVGLVRYAVTSVNDSLYHLTVFVANEVNVIFDELNCSVQVDTSAIGKVRFEVNVTYQYDGRPVTGANVTVDDLQATEFGSGTYIAEVPEWKPYGTYHTRIVKENLTTNLETTVLVTGNAVVIGLAVVIIVMSILVSLVYLRGRRRKIAAAVENERQMP